MKVLQRIPIAPVFLAGVALLLISLIVRLTDPLAGMNIAVIILTAGYLGWLLLESRVALGRPGTEAKNDDRGTGQAIILARMANMACAVLLPAMWAGWRAWMVAPILLFFAGIALRRSAITTLGRFYSRRVRTLTDHEVVTSGPYRFLRHPAYTGVIVAHVAMTVVLLNIFSVISLLALVVPAFLWRINVEERLLLQMPGYAEFARTRPRLVPFVW